MVQFIVILQKSIAMTAAEHESDLKLTTDIPYLTPTGELWGVCWEEIEENERCYAGSTLYLVSCVKHLIQLPPLWWLFG